MADVFPPNPTTPVGLVRFLVSDTQQLAYDPGQPARYIFPDEQYQAYITLAGEGRYKAAAANALRAMAAQEAIIGKVIRTEDLQVDGAKLADSLRLLARELDGQQKSEDDDAAVAEFGFEVVSYPYPYHNMEW
jgi:hypothetical protein